MWSGWDPRALWVGCENRAGATETDWQFLKQLKIEPPHEAATPPLGINPKEFKPGSQRDTCAPRSQQHYSHQPSTGPGPAKCPRRMSGGTKVASTHEETLLGLDKE